MCTSASTLRQLSQGQHALRQCDPLTLVPQTVQVMTGWLAQSATSWPAPQPGLLQCRYLGSCWASFTRQTSSSAGSATRWRSCSVRREGQAGAKMHGNAPCSSEGRSLLQTRPCNLQRRLLLKQAAHRSFAVPDLLREVGLHALETRIRPVSAPERDGRKTIRRLALTADRAGPF